MGNRSNIKSIEKKKEYKMRAKIVERLYKFVICVVLIPVLISVAILLVGLSFILPIVALINPKLITINKKGE